MSFIGDMREAVEHLAVFAELDVEAAVLPASVRELSDDSVRDLVDEVGRITQGWHTLQTLLAGVVAQRSTRDRGHEGLAAGGGYRTPVEMIQVVTGATKAEAARAVKVGASLLDGADAGAPGAEPVSPDEAAHVPWHAPLRDAMLGGRITQAQYDAILRGLGEPPQREGEDLSDAWRCAASELAQEAGQWTVEELRGQARTLRDLLDQEGAQDRLREHFEARSLRVWRDANGRRRGDIVFDPEMGEWFDSVFAAALRPRRGGPRFVAEDEKQAAQALIDDPRTNEQLAYDLFVDLVRAGTLAEAKDVCGSREPGVRLVVVKDAVTGDDVHRDALGRLVAVGHTEDGAATIDGVMIERALCAGGSIDVTLDSCGRPLDVGREARLYTVKQRVALSVRDGGCMWPGCDRPASMTEAHHCKPWSQGGATDLDDGILLCRFHHVHLHFRGWAIENDGAGRFLLVMGPDAGGAGLGAGFGGGLGGGLGAGLGARDPVGAGRETVELTSKSPLRWMWDPPPDRPSWRTAPAAPEPAVPEATVPETTVPEATVPEATVPETAVSETAVSEFRPVVGGLGEGRRGEVARDEPERDEVALGEGVWGQGVLV